MIFPAGRSLPQKRLLSPLTNPHGPPAALGASPASRVQLPPISLRPATPGVLLTAPRASRAFPQSAIVGLGTISPLDSQFKQDFQHHPDFQSIQPVPAVPAGGTPPSGDQHEAALLVQL